MIHNGPVPSPQLRSRPTSLFLFLAGIVALILFVSFYLGAYGVPDGAFPASGPLEITAPDGSIKMAPAEWFTGASADPEYKPGVYRFAFSIRVSDPDPRGEWLLFLPQAYGNALRVNVGGQDAGSIGDMENGDSNIWNPGKVFRIKPGSVSQNTRIVVEINGRYEAGFTKRPYLMPARTGAWKALFFKVFTDQGIWSLCGAILTLGLVILIIGSFSPPKLDSRFYFGLAAIFAAAFLSDFISVEYLPMGLLLFKKSVSISRHVSAALFAVAACRMLGRKKDWFVIAYAALQAACIIVLLVPQTMPLLKRTYGITYLFIFPVLVYLPVAILVRGRREEKLPDRGLGEALGFPYGFGFLLFGAFAGIGAGMYDSVSLLLHPGGVCISQFGFLVLFLSVSAYVILDILGHFRQLVIEKMRSARFQQEALRDHMTDAFNRKILPLLLDETRVKTAVMMLDLDDLKGINDNYGHQVGDVVLKDLVTTVRRNIRQSDYLVRLGGDEFVVFLPGCPERKLEMIVKHVLSDFESSCVPLAGLSRAPFARAGAECPPLSYRVSIGTAVSGEGGILGFEALQDLIAKADAALYKSKTAGKAQATFG